MSRQNHSSEERELSRAPWPFSAAAFLVNRLAAPASEKVTQMRDGYGMKCSASFAKLDRAGLWRKTCGGFSQPRLFQTEENSLEEYSETWPKMGIVRDGFAMALEMSARRISGKGCLSWRTPRASDGEGGVMEMREGVAGKYKLRDHAHPKNAHTWPTPRSQKVQWIGPSLVNRNKGNLEEEVAKEYWPKPKNRDYRSPRGGAGKQRDNPDLNVTAYMQENKPQKGQLNPAWVTLLMGFPPGWLDIDGPPDQAPSTPGNRRE